MKIYVTAIIESKPEFLEDVKSVLENMVVQTQKEAACLQYDLHQSNDDENVFIFYEIWANKTGLDEHNKMPYIKEFINLSDKLISSPQLFFSKKL